MRAKDILTPLVAPSPLTDNYEKGEGPNVSPVYFSRLFVRADSSYMTFEDLQGSRFAYNDDSSLSGYHCVIFFLRSYMAFVSQSRKQLPSSGRDLTPPIPTMFLDTPSEVFFSSGTATGSHYNSVCAVLSDKADVMCLDCNVLAQLSQSPEGKEKLRQLRAIDVPGVLHYPTEELTWIGGAGGLLIPTSTHTGHLGPNPSQPVVVSNRLPAVLQKRIQTAFLRMGPEVLRPMMVSHFVAVDANYYLSVTCMIEDCARRMFIGGEETENTASPSGSGDTGGCEGSCVDEDIT